jgi:ubiquinone/menaquinone biosynthesis C-methylase UbiE
MEAVRPPDRNNAAMVTSGRAEAEAYIGRWSRLVAGEFMEWIAVPDGGTWLDIGCGTGELTRVILDRCQPSAVTGVDPSGPFLALAVERTADRRAEFREGDAQALPFEDGLFDACVSGLVLNFVPEPKRGVSEMARVTRGGGTVAAYVWDYAGRWVITTFSMPLLP